MHMDCLPGSEHHTGHLGTQSNESDTVTDLRGHRSSVADLSLDTINIWEPF